MSRRGGPLLVCLLTCALLAGSVYAAERVGAEPPARGAAARFVPADGAAAYLQVDSGAAAPVHQVVESARGPGLALTQGLTFYFGALMLQSLGGREAPPVRAWRTTTTTITAAYDRTAQPDMRLYRVQGSVELMGEATATVGRIYRPALVELPADVAPGATWSTRGAANLAGLTYSSEFRAEAADGGCLRVTGTVAYADPNAPAPPAEQHDKLWCPGRGLVEQRVTVGAVTTRTAVVPAPPLPERPMVSPPVRWPDPATWRVHSYGVRTLDVFGEYAMVGTPTLVPPVPTASGDLYRVVQQTGDLVRLTPHTAADWRLAARMHPGGSVLTVSGYGDLVVVTSSLRQAVGYTADGVRLWTADLPEIVTIAADRASPTEGLLCDVAGGLRRFDLRTGAVRWTRDVGYGVDISPVVGAGVVVVTDGGGRQTAYAVGDGSVRWRTERPAGASLFAGSQLVDIDRNLLEAVDPADGSVRWRRVAEGALNQLSAVGDRVVVATSRGTSIVAPDGSEVARLPSYVEVTTTDAYVVGWTRTTGEVWSRDGRRLATWTPPDLFTRAIAQPVAEADGLRVAYVNWRLDTWTGGR